MCGSPKILEMLMSSKGFTKSDFYMGQGKFTPLHLAASGGYPKSLEICKTLLKHGKVSVNAVNNQQKTPLHLAGAAHDVDIIKLLLSYGANVNATDKDGRTPLFNVISDSRDGLSCLRAFCEVEKCDVNHQDDQGHTALHFAAFEETGAAAQILLMKGADFSLKTHAGLSALSVLCRKIPNTEKMIRSVFDHAVRTSYYYDDNDETQALPESNRNCKVKVNFTYVTASSPTIKIIPQLPSTLLKHQQSSSIPQSPDTKKYTSPSFKTNTNPSQIRKETAKIKCLVDENLGSLLLHPLVHSFLVLKWQKARNIFFVNFFFKAVLVILFSIYVQLPYLLGDKPMDNSTNTKFAETFANNGTNTSEENVTMTSTVTVGFKGGIPNWFVFIYVVIVTMTMVNGIIEVAQILRSPKTQLRSLEPWIFLSVVLIMILYMNPRTWGKTGDLLHRSMAAAGICLAWMDIWIYMGRFPAFGLSIRIFFKVLQNFTIFIIPHFCLFAGFVLSFTLLFPQDPEYSNVFLTLSKAVRIMAGDNGLAPEGILSGTFPNTPKEILCKFIMVYIYTAFVLTVGIVLMNMLIGLAVHDIQGIYAEASMNRLTKQTILLNTLDTNFNGKWIRSWIPKTFLAKYVNLFSSSSQNKILAFKPYDPRDTKLSTDLKLALAKISKKEGKPSIQSETAFSSSSSTINMQRWMDALSELTTNKKIEEKILVRKINALVEKVDLLTETLNSRHTATSLE